MCHDSVYAGVGTI